MDGPDGRGADRSGQQGRRQTAGETGRPSPVEFIWESRGIGPQENHSSDPAGRARIPFPDHAPRPARTCSSIIHHAYSALAPRCPGQILGHRGQLTPPGSLSPAAGHAPALPPWLSRRRGDPWLLPMAGPLPAAPGGPGLRERGVRAKWARKPGGARPLPPLPWPPVWGPALSPTGALEDGSVEFRGVC